MSVQNFVTVHDFCIFAGVDIVLNSLAEEKLFASVRVLAKHGKFLEIGKVDLANNAALGKISTLRQYFVS